MLKKETLEKEENNSSVEVLFNYVKTQPNYETDNSLFSYLLNFILNSHMEKEKKHECDIKNCQGYKEEMDLVIGEFQKLLKKTK